MGGFFVHPKDCHIMCLSMPLKKTGMSAIMPSKGCDGMHRLLCPSMMCADFGQLREEVFALDDAGVDIFHCDVMDGTYAPNMTLGLNDIRAIRAHTEKLLDVHLMIENPGDKIDWFIDAGADILYIHPHTDRFPTKTILRIKERDKKAGVVINPDESLSTFTELFPLVDYILVMTVHPGFAGQKFLEFTAAKIKALVELKKIHNFKILIDGNCTPAIIEKYHQLGVDGFILGTSALFNQGKSYQQLMEELR